MAARAGKARQQLPQRRLLPPHQIEDHLGAAARRLDRRGRWKILGHQRAIERQVREVMPAEAAGEAFASDLRVGELVDLAREPLRLGLGRGDHRAQARQDQHLRGLAPLGSH